MKNDDARKIVGENLGTFKIDCDDKDIKKVKKFVSNYNGGGSPPCIEDLKLNQER